MRSVARHLIFALTVTLSAVAPMPVSGAEPGPDWLLIRMTAGPDGATASLNVSTRYATRAGGTSATLFAGSRIGALEPHRPYAHVMQGGLGGIHVVTSTGSGSERTTLLPGGPHPGSTYSFGGGAEMLPGETVFELIAHANGHLTEWDISPVVEAGSVEVEEVTGRGTAALYPTSGSAGGVAASAGNAWASTGSTVTARPEAGIVGVQAPLFCSCNGSWAGPGWRHGSWGQRYSTRSGVDMFAGPAGDWSFSIAGTGASETFLAEPVIGVYAPIGDDYRLFEPQPA